MFYCLCCNCFCKFSFPPQQKSCEISLQIHYELISEGPKATCSTRRKEEREREGEKETFPDGKLAWQRIRQISSEVCLQLKSNNRQHTPHTHKHKKIVLLCCSMFVTLLLRVCVCVCGTVLICNWHCILNRLHLAHQRPGHRDARTHGHRGHKANAKSRDAPSN